MMVVSTLPVLYEALKLYCKVHSERGFDLYGNGTLYRIAMARPREAAEIEALLPEDEFFRKTGPELVEVVKLFTANPNSDSLNARARNKLEQIELRLYDRVVGHLKSRYRQDWWFGGVPESIRIRAAQLFEESEGEIAKESALYLRDLKEIILIEWGSLKDELADPRESKRQYESRFSDLLELRNRLSHPIRLKESPIEEEEVSMLDRWLDSIAK